jgi:hypothetical protein
VKWRTQSRRIKLAVPRLLVIVRLGSEGTRFFISLISRLDAPRGQSLKDACVRALY